MGRLSDRERTIRAVLLEEFDAGWKAAVDGKEKLYGSWLNKAARRIESMFKDESEQWASRYFDDDDES